MLAALIRLTCTDLCFLKQKSALNIILLSPGVQTRPYLFKPFHVGETRLAFHSPIQFETTFMITDIIYATFNHH